MADEVKTTQEQEAQNPVDATTAQSEEQKAQTIGDLIGTPAETKEEPKTVGLDKFLKEKEARKVLEKQLKELKSSIEDGATKAEISESLSELSEEYPDVDPKFLSKLAQSIKAEAKKELDVELASKLKPFEEKEKKTKLSEVFEKGVTQALAEVPEYANVINKDVIFKLSLLPENGKKTFVELIEETYSNAIGGKRTLSTSTPTGRQEPQALDVARARKDTEYFKEVMSNPKLKAQYNQAIIDRGL